MSSRKSSGGGSPLSSIFVVLSSLVVFLLIVGGAISIIGADVVDPPNPSDVPDASSSAPVEPSEPTTSTPSTPTPPTDTSSAVTPPTSSETPATSSTAPVVSSTVEAGVTPPTTTTPTPSPTPASTLTGIFDPATVGSSGQSSIASYKAINSDVMAWLKVPGTNINYPVLYYASNNDYYLERDLYKNYSKNGVIYGDYENRFGTSDDLSRNNIIYGHNWTNVSSNPRIGNANDVMFAQLTSYHHLNFAKENPYIHYSTEDEEMLWVVFAAFYTDTSFPYIYGNPSDADFANIINGAIARSRHIIDTDVNTSDTILTLSTCTRAYGSSDQQRFVVMARLMRPGETVEAVAMSSNPNPVLPNL